VKNSGIGHWGPKHRKASCGGRGNLLPTLVEKTKPIYRPLAGNQKFETRNSKQVERVRLKNKPNLRWSQMNLKSIIKRKYEKNIGLDTW
jgi:hypothetical protein